MLPAYYWLDSPDEAYLRFNYGSVAWVRADIAGFGVTINWRGKYITGRAASIAQGKRHIQKWIEARGDLWPAARPTRLRFFRLFNDDFPFA